MEKLPKLDFSKKTNFMENGLVLVKLGKKIAMGSYVLGKKNGQWFFWKEDNLIEVVFENNVVLDKVEWGNKNKIVLNEL